MFHHRKSNPKLSEESHTSHQLPAVVSADAKDNLAETRASFETLEAALLTLHAFTGEPRVPASTLINPLLDVWDVARRVGPEVAAPAEALLGLSVRRSTLTSDEIVACIDDIRARAVESSVLARVATS